MKTSFVAYNILMLLGSSFHRSVYVRDAMSFLTGEVYIKTLPGKLYGIFKNLNNAEDFLDDMFIRLSKQELIKFKKEKDRLCAEITKEGLKFIFELERDYLTEDKYKNFIGSLKHEKNCSL